MIISNNLSLQLNYKMIISKTYHFNSIIDKNVVIFVVMHCLSFSRRAIRVKQFSQSKSICFSDFQEFGVFEIDSHLAQSVKVWCFHTRSLVFSFLNQYWDTTQGSISKKLEDNLFSSKLIMTGKKLLKVLIVQRDVYRDRILAKNTVGGDYLSTWLRLH